LEPALNRMGSLRSSLFRDFDEAKEAWRSLEKTSDHYPFQTWAWLDAWYVETGRDRAALRGKITTKVPDLPAE